MDEHFDLVVVGAGLAGLSAARTAVLAGSRVLVIDPHGIGGRASTDVREGFRFNRGPHALYRGGPAERLLHELGVRWTGTAPPTDQSSGRRGDLIAPLPATVRQLLSSPFLGLRGKTALGRFMARLPKLVAARYAATPTQSWIEDAELPADAAALVHLLVRLTTYVNVPAVSSAEMTIAQMQLALGAGVVYLDQGWASLGSQLADGVTILDDEVVRVEHDGQRPVVRTVAGREIRSERVVVAVNSPAAAARLLGRAPFDAGPPALVACLDLGVRRPSQPRLLMGLDEPLYLSTHCPPADLAPDRCAVVHVARYLAAGDRNTPDELRHQLFEHASMAGITADDVVVERYLHKMVAVSAIATAAGGGLAGRVSCHDSGIEGVTLAGDWVGPEGHLADASIASGVAAARRAPVRACP